MADESQAATDCRLALPARLAQLAARMRQEARVARTLQAVAGTLQAASVVLMLREAWVALMLPEAPVARAALARWVRLVGWPPPGLLSRQSD